MSQENLINEILATYQKHGWELRRALLRPETLAAITESGLLSQAHVEDSQIDALWFSRASHGQREAWELRLVATTQYALFENFEAEEEEEAREELRREMEARMRLKVLGDGD
jgi:hypothetical protein